MKKTQKKKKVVVGKGISKNVPLESTPKACMICGKNYNPQNSNSNFCSKQCLTEFMKG